MLAQVPHADLCVRLLPGMETLIYDEDTDEMFSFETYVVEREPALELFLHTEKTERVPVIVGTRITDLELELLQRQGVVVSFA